VRFVVAIGCGRRPRWDIRVIREICRIQIHPNSPCTNRVPESYETVFGFQCAVFSKERKESNSSSPSWLRVSRLCQKTETRRVSEGDFGATSRNARSPSLTFRVTISTFLTKPSFSLLIPKQDTMSNRAKSHL
jgi:hypothetical protein